MRILVIGAGAVGGYFGGRLLAAGRDVTFLVREARAAALKASGLVIRSVTGDVTLPHPPTVTAASLDGPFDLILLSCKAYDLDEAMAAFAPAVGPATAILPLLNGLDHLDRLDARFGRLRVLGGQCLIAATLDSSGAILHLNDSHALSFGERGEVLSERVRAIAAEMAGAGFSARASEQIMQEMWEKWVMLAALAGATCLMRASVGDILAAPAGNRVLTGLLEECRAIAAANGHAPRDSVLARARTMLTTPGSSLTASMMRDVERYGRTEADHILGDMIARRPPQPADTVPLLDIAYAALKAYEARESRDAAAPAG
jgi:2-dehydropantoate 2-reductase